MRGAHSSKSRGCAVCVCLVPCPGGERVTLRGHRKADEGTEGYKLTKYSMCVPTCCG